MCAVCRQPVERMESYEDAEVDRMVFTAYCHGKREQTVVDSDYLRRLKGIDVGEAFRPRGTLLAAKEES